MHGMKIYRFIISFAVIMIMVSCADKGDKYAFQYVSFKESIPYERGKESPACSFDFNVLKAHGADTIFADAFNVDISYTLFGKRTTDVRGAMISFVDSIINDFKVQNNEQRDYAKQNGIENPYYFDFEYSVDTEISYGNGVDIIGCNINWYQYTGGAHGGTFITCRNYRLEDGSVVTLDNYFKPGYEKVLIPVLEKHLLKETGCPDREHLDDYGYFPEQPMFVPDNFQILKDSIAFIFNQYDIAPYSTGITTLFVPNDEIRDIIK